MELQRIEFALRPNPEALPDFTLFQSDAWMRFLVETQGGDPIAAVLHEKGNPIGWLTGMVTRKFGVRVFGSPLPGWSTPYMGFNLLPQANLADVLRTLPEFVFNQLSCVHLELLHRSAAPPLATELHMAHRIYSGYEIDLTMDEDVIFSRMTSACRRCIRKSEKDGVIVEQAQQLDFADEYYSQLHSVFRRQGLVPTYGIDRVRSLIRNVQPSGRLLLLRARDSTGLCVATGIFPADSRTMYFWGGASHADARSSRPNEAIQWHAMRFWKARGVIRYDMGGGGEYKRKYGGDEIAIPWFRASKSPAWAALRNAGLIAFRTKQRLLGRLGK